MSSRLRCRSALRRTSLTEGQVVRRLDHPGADHPAGDGWLLVDAGPGQPQVVDDLVQPLLQVRLPGAPVPGGRQGGQRLALVPGLRLGGDGRECGEPAPVGLRCRVEDLSTAPHALREHSWLHDRRPIGNTDTHLENVLGGGPKQHRVGTGTADQLVAAVQGRLVLPIGPGHPHVAGPLVALDLDPEALDLRDHQRGPTQVGRRQRDRGRLRASDGELLVVEGPLPDHGGTRRRARCTSARSPSDLPSVA